MGRRIALALAAVGLLLACAPIASADLASLKAACRETDAADADLSNGAQLPFRFCDDGVPPTGGTRANEGAVAAVAVPQRYDGAAGLPAKLPAEPGTGADSDGNIALDVDVSLPDPQRHPPPPGGYPLLVFMHGCCSGDKRSWETPTIDRTATGGAIAERWRYSNAWFASRGYVVVTYTARGFVSSASNGTRGSTGQTQLDDTRFELNDFQHLAGQLADDPFFRVDPSNVIATGGSYGGGFTWVALTDPTWTSPGGRPMALRAVAPRYGWTDLVQSLVPNGTLADRLPPADGSGSTQPLGFPKRSILAGLFGAGATGVPPLTSAHATFPSSITAAFACFQSTDPYPANPLCADTLRTTVPAFVAFRSAYYQQRFFDRLAAGDPSARVPVFSAGTFTDPLFPPEEHRFMAERLKATSPGYPIQEYYGDYQHFAQNKRKEWADLCGADDHVCTLADYPDGDLDAAPPNRTRQGVHSRLNAFLDHYARPPANRRQPAPAHDVTASLQICPQTATERFPADQPGERFTAPSFAELADGVLRIDAEGEQRTTNPAVPNPHAKSADPVVNQVANGNRCVVERSDAGPGVATYDSAPLAGEQVLIGRTRLTVTHRAQGPAVQLNARLYDLFPDGTQVMVDRGVRRLAPGEATGTTVLDLHGNGWRFAPGHRVRLELAQDDDPYIRASTLPSAMTISRVRMELPVREGSSRIAGAAGCTPARGFRSASVAGRGRALRIRFRRGLRRPVDVDVFQVSRGRRVLGQRLVARFGRRSRSFTWSGRANRRGRAVRDGELFVRVRMRLPGGREDVRRLAVRRAGGRFRARPAFYRRNSCGTIRSFKLERPVFGGRSNRALGIAFRLGPRARATVTLLRGTRRLRTLRTRVEPANRQVRLRLPSERLRRGDYRIRLQVRPAGGGRTVTATLTARRL